MRTLLAALGIALAAAAVGACGATVGDACTTASDCGAGTCLQGPTAPGGYCSKSCGDGGPCPNGSACVPGAGTNGADSCLLRCATPQDCRQGYNCRSFGGSPLVCVGS